MTNFIRIAGAFCLCASLPSLLAQPPEEKTLPLETSVLLSPSPRERISCNDHWRFQKNDPTGNTVPLLYDVRPEVKDVRDDKAADSRPDEVAQQHAMNQSVLKPWILPTGNAFINATLYAPSNPRRI